MGESNKGQDEVAVAGPRGTLAASHDVAVGGSRGIHVHDVVVVGAGVVGCAVAWALTKAGRRVLLIDRSDPATAGASFGNVGHIATEQLQPLPSSQLLLSFWHELTAFGGVLDIPLRRVAVMAPWIARFARAAFQQRQHTEHLAPLVRCAADTLESQLGEVGKRDLLRRHGHYALWFGPKAAKRAAAEQARAGALGVATKDAPLELLRAAAEQASWRASASPDTRGAQAASAPPSTRGTPGAPTASPTPRDTRSPTLATRSADAVPAVAGVGSPTAHTCWIQRLLPAPLQSHQPKLALPCCARRFGTCALSVTASKSLPTRTH